MIEFVPMVDFLAIPNHPDPDGVDSYVRRVIEFAELANIELLRFLPSLGTIEKLIEAGQYPFITDIKNMLSKAGTTVYSAEDINRVLTSLFTQVNTLETESGVTDILWSNEMFTPELSWIKNTALLHDATRVLLSVALWSLAKPTHKVIVGSGQGQHSAIIAHACIEIIEGRYPLPQQPYLLLQTVLAAGSFPAIIAHIDMLDLVKGAESPEDLTIAIRIAVLKNLQNTNLDARFSDIPTFAVRPELITTADRYSFRTTTNRIERLLRAIVDIVLQRNLAQGHALRVSTAGSSPPLKRGSATAWRHDIDDEFHLHLWKCEEGPELVKIVVHNDFTIDV